MMNREDMLLLCDYLEGQNLISDKMKKLRDKVQLIKTQIECQDKIQNIQKELAEMDKIKEK